MKNCKIVIAYHSGYGHTEKVAKYVAQGAKEITSDVISIKVNEIDDAGWNALDAADAIIFGSPTYMGGVSGPFKTFLDATAGRWFQRKWTNKIAAGFTNGGSTSGDKLNTLVQMVITSMQHGMIWVGANQMGPNKSGTDVATAEDLNRMGSYTGLMTQSNNESAEIVPPSGDLETAKIFGKRIAEVAAKLA